MVQFLFSSAPQYLKGKQDMISTLAILLDFSLTEKAATLIFISGCCLAISSAIQGKSGFIYNFGKK